MMGQWYCGEAVVGHCGEVVGQWYCDGAVVL